MLRCFHYIISVENSKVYEQINMDPSKEEKLVLMEWKFWVEGVLIPCVGIPGV